MMKYLLPTLLILGLHVVFILNNTYSIDRIDSVMHFAGGIALGILVAGILSLAERRGMVPPPGRLLTAVLVFGLVSTGAVFWEFYEWLSDHYLGTLLQLTVDDTIKDLAFGCAGGMVSALLQLRTATRDRTAARQPQADVIVQPGK